MALPSVISLSLWLAGPLPFPALPTVDQHNINPHAKFTYLEVIRWERHSGFGPRGWCRAHIASLSPGT